MQCLGEWEVWKRLALTPDPMRRARSRASTNMQQRRRKQPICQTEASIRNDLLDADGVRWELEDAGFWGGIVVQPVSAVTQRRRFCQCGTSGALKCHRETTVGVCVRQVWESGTVAVSAVAKMDLWEGWLGSGGGGGAGIDFKQAAHVSPESPVRFIWMLSA